MMRRLHAVVLFATLAFPLFVPAAGEDRVERAPAASVVVAFQSPVALPAGTLLELHIEVPTGQRFRFPFRRLSDAERRDMLGLSEIAQRKARREDAAPEAAPAAGSDHAHSGSSRAPATPSPEPAAGSDHAHSGTSRATPATPEPDPMAGSHAGSGTARAHASAPAPVAARPRLVNATRKLGSHPVVASFAPAVVTVPLAGPSFGADVVLHGCPEADHYAATAGRCPRHGQALQAGLPAGSEAAVVLDPGGAPANLRLQFP